jgi:hypothetical protein
VRLRDPFVPFGPAAVVPSSQYQTNASTISITVTQPAGNTFYRLQKM